jgi:hypothetical protein
MRRRKLSSHLRIGRTPWSQSSDPMFWNMSLRKCGHQQVEVIDPTSRTRPLTITAQFFGRVFQLTRQDGLSALASEHVRGGVFLTEPYSTGSLPLVTFSISEDLSQEFALQRPQAM